MHSHAILIVNAITTTPDYRRPPLHHHPPTAAAHTIRLKPNTSQSTITNHLLALTSPLPLLSEPYTVTEQNDSADHRFEESRASE